MKGLFGRHDLCTTCTPGVWRQGWTLDMRGGKMTPASGKSFPSIIEKGKRGIFSTTVGKLIKALDLDEGW